MEKNDTLLKNWPANSPDLSPIEQIWGIAKRFIIQRFGMVTPIANNELERAVFDAYEQIAPTTIAILTLSVKYRTRLCVDRYGGFDGDGLDECSRHAKDELEASTTIQTRTITLIATERNEQQGHQREESHENLPRLPSFRNAQ